VEKNSIWGVKLSNHHDIVLTLRIRGATTPLPPCIFITHRHNFTFIHRYRYTFLFRVLLVTQSCRVRCCCHFMLRVSTDSHVTSQFRTEYQESSRGIKGGRHVRLTALPLSVSRLSRENVGASTSHNPMGLHGRLQG
jgi:hypothetical protein